MNLFGTENFKTLGLNVLPILKDTLLLPMLIDNQYDATVVNKDEGSTITVKRPVVFVAKDFTSTIELQSIDRKLVDIKLNTFKDISFKLTTQEATFIMNGNTKKSEELLKPAMAALSDAANAKIVELFQKIPFYSGDPAKAFDTPSAFTTPRKALKDRHVPTGSRNMVLGTAMFAEALGVDAFRDADKTGTTTALRDASLGRLFQFDTYESDQDLTHIVGEAVTLAAADITLSADSNATLAPDNNDVVDSEFNTMALTGLGAGNVNAGDLFSITQDGQVYQFTVKETVASAAGAASVKVFPVYRFADPADNDTVKPVVFTSAAVLEFAGKTEGQYETSIAFHKSFAAFVPVSLPNASGLGVTQTVISADNLTFRLTSWYSPEDKIFKFSVDMLSGYAVLYPELAQLIIGG